MDARTEPANRYAGETPPFISAELDADLEAPQPSADALEWLEATLAAAEGDPRPPLTSGELELRTQAWRARRMKRAGR